MIEEVEATGGAERPDDKMKDKTTTKKGKSTPGSKKKKKQTPKAESVTESANFQKYFLLDLNDNQCYYVSHMPC